MVVHGYWRFVDTKGDAVKCMSYHHATDDLELAPTTQSKQRSTIRGHVGIGTDGPNDLLDIGDGSSE